MSSKHSLESSDDFKEGHHQANGNVHRKEEFVVSGKNDDHLPGKGGKAAILLVKHRRHLATHVDTQSRLFGGSDSVTAGGAGQCEIDGRRMMQSKGKGVPGANGNSSHIFKEFQPLSKPSLGKGRQAVAAPLPRDLHEGPKKENKNRVANESRAWFKFENQPN